MDSRELAKEGWQERFAGAGLRLKETVELYRELGFEVHLEPVTGERLATTACNECYLVQSGLFYTVYTRRRPAG